MTSLDPHDYAILHMLQANARERMEDIAARTGLSVATVQRRIRTLRTDGVISGESVVIQPELVGFGMTFLVMVELERERLVEIEAFRAQVAAEPQIQQCYYVTGDFDFVLIVLTQDVERFKLLTHRLFFDNSNVKRFRTSLVMDRTKVTLTVPFEVPHTAVEEPQARGAASPGATARRTPREAPQRAARGTEPGAERKIIGRAMGGAENA